MIWKKTTVDYIRMFYISYSLVCELETQVLLAEDLGFIEKTFRKQTLEPLNPWTLFSNKLEKNLQ
jgi:hypothetical protein